MRPCSIALGFSNYKSAKPSLATAIIIPFCFCFPPPPLPFPHLSYSPPFSHTRLPPTTLPFQINVIVYINTVLWKPTFFFIFHQFRRWNLALRMAFQSFVISYVRKPEESKGWTGEEANEVGRGGVGRGKRRTMKMI